MSIDSRDLGVIAGHLYDIKLALDKNNSILNEKLGVIGDELCLARRDFDILVGISTPEIELLNREKDEVQKEIDLYSGLFPDECVEYRIELDKNTKNWNNQYKKQRTNSIKSSKGVNNGRD